MKWIDLPPVWLALFLVLGATMPRGDEIFYEQALMGVCLILAGLADNGAAGFEQDFHRVVAKRGEQWRDIVGRFRRLFIAVTNT